MRGPGWDEDAIARLTDKYQTPPEDEPRPRNPFLPALQDEEGPDSETLERLRAS